MGQHNSTQHSIGIENLAYQTDTYMLAADYESVLQMGFTGTSLRAGGQLQLQLSNMNLGGAITASSTDAIKRCYILLMYDLVVEIDSQGITVLD
jgi:hypothetical protein